jgi:hypothetical protein
MSFSRRVFSTWTLTVALLQGKLAARRDPARAQRRAPRVPFLTVTRGQRRSLTSSVAGYPQVGINAGHGLDRCPTFQAGAQM